MRYLRLSVWAILVAAHAVHAQESGRGLFPRETRSVVREQRDLKLLDIRSLVAEKEKKVAVDATLGVGYTSLDGGGHGVNIPFELSATLPNEGKTNFRVNGDGYAWSNVGGVKADGFSDVEASVSHSFFGPLPALRLGLGLKAGVGGDAGSKTDAVFLTSSYKQPLGERWVGAVSLKVREDLNNTPAGQRKTVLAGGLQLRYLFDPKGRLQDVFIQLARARRVHDSGSSVAVVGLDVGLMPAWSGTIQFARGLTAGSRSSTIEFDITRSF